MHESRSIIGRDVVGEDDVVRIRDVDEVKWTLVRRTLKVASREPLQDVEVLAQGRLRQVLCDDEDVAIGCPGHDIDRARVDGDGGIGHQGPRCGRPHEQGCTRVPIHERTGGDGEAHVDGRIHHGFVALSQFMVGQSGAAAGAVGGDPMVLDQEPLVEDLGQGPPHAFDVARVHRPVGVIHVDPKAHAASHLVELINMAEHGFATPGVELSDAVGLDIPFAGEAELLFHGEFHG